MFCKDGYLSIHGVFGVIVEWFICQWLIVMVEYSKKKNILLKKFFSRLGARYVGPKTKLVEELRHELYDGIGGYEG